MYILDITFISSKSLSKVLSSRHCFSWQAWCSQNSSKIFSVSSNCTSSLQHRNNTNSWRVIGAYRGGLSDRLSDFFPPCSIRNTRGLPGGRGPKPTGAKGTEKRTKIRIICTSKRKNRITTNAYCSKELKSPRKCDLGRHKIFFLKTSYDTDGTLLTDRTDRTDCIRESKFTSASALPSRWSRANQMKWLLEIVY